MNIYVGNLSYDVTEEQLRELFTPFGQVDSVSIITDRVSGRPRGFGFVSMPEKAEAQAAIDKLEGQESNGRTLKVSEARGKTSSPRRGGSGRRDNFRSRGGGYRGR